MPFKDYEKVLLTGKCQDAVKNFDCCIRGSNSNNCEKLNNFVKNEAVQYNTDNLSRTNLIVKDGVCVAFYSLAMNAIKEPRIEVGVEYKTLKSYPALFLTRLAVDKNHQNKNIGKDILNSIIKQGYENKEIAARFLFLDAYPESISWYLHNTLFEILYTALSERIEKMCEKKILGELNERLINGHIIKCTLNCDGEIDGLRKNCNRIINLHIENIFEEFKNGNPLFKECRSKIELEFENNKPIIKMKDFITKENLPIIKEWLKNKKNILNLDITIPLYADINKYYKAIYG